jgi:hypothetical protein
VKSAAGIKEKIKREEPKPNEKERKEEKIEDQDLWISLCTSCR